MNAQDLRLVPQLCCDLVSPAVEWAPSEALLSGGRCENSGGRSTENGARGALGALPCMLTVTVMSLLCLHWPTSAPEQT